MPPALHSGLVFLCAALVVLATVPVLTGLFQYALLGASGFATHLESTGRRLPRVAIMIPAWNEGMVIGTTVDRLCAVDYPHDSLRVYVIDDASTDETPSVVIDKMKRFPGRVFHIRRVAGGEGKAHTLNYGLERILGGPWAEAVLVMDADVIYTDDSIAKMARHLTDARVGAVTAYIKEGSADPNYVQRFVGFEYITATGCSRRAQNVLGVLACLSGGAQLHSRENLNAIGGRIFSHTLAEDTFTTFRTQLRGRKALFEPKAVVYAEEPDALVGLWKQRIRWARGNVQITRVYRNLWFDPSAHEGLGSFAMGVLWFSIFLMPLFQIGATLGLIGLQFLDSALAWEFFEGFYIIAAFVYLVVTLGSFVVDPYSAKRTWMEGLLFPGFISLGVMLFVLVAPLFPSFAFDAAPPDDSTVALVGRLLLYAWLSLSMVVTWLAKEAEDSGRWAWLARPLLYIGGYGSFLCAVTFGAYVKEWQGASLAWDKTVKTGKVG